MEKIEVIISCTFKQYKPYISLIYNSLPSHLPSPLSSSLLSSSWTFPELHLTGKATRPGLRQAARHCRSVFIVSHPRHGPSTPGLSVAKRRETAENGGKWRKIAGGNQRCHTGAFYVRSNSFSYDLAWPSDRGGQIFKIPYFH